MPAFRKNPYLPPQTIMIYSKEILNSYIQSHNGTVDSEVKSNPGNNLIYEDEQAMWFAEAVGWKKYIYRGGSNCSCALGFILVCEVDMKFFFKLAVTNMVCAFIILFWFISSQQVSSHF